jgi:hypothetical protein
MLPKELVQARMWWIWPEEEEKKFTLIQRTMVPAVEHRLLVNWFGNFQWRRHFDSPTELRTTELLKWPNLDYDWISNGPTSKNIFYTHFLLKFKMLTYVHRWIHGDIIGKTFLKLADSFIQWYHYYFIKEGSNESTFCICFYELSIFCE